MLTAAATRRVFCLAKCVKVVVLELLLSYDCILITHCVPPQSFCAKELWGDNYFGVPLAPREGSSLSAACPTATAV